MLTEFGKALRKLRIDCGELLRDMADNLGCTASYLSAIETGKRPVPVDWIERITDKYNLDDERASELKTAAMAEIRTVRIDVDSLLGKKKETAILFAREFPSVDETTVEQIRKLLKNK